MELTIESWYTQLIDECKDIIVECEFTARWSLVEGYHAVGKRILQDESNFTKGGYTIDGMLSQVSTSLDKSERTIRRAIQFARKFPDLNALPEGKDVSWHKVCNLYLPQPSESPTGKEDYLLCKSCGSEIMPVVIPCGHCGTVFEIKKDDIRRR